MLQIFMRIGTVDMDGFQGREHHPTKEMEGRFVRITNMDTVPPVPLVDGGDLGSYQLFHGILVDANGNDVDGGEVELIDHEIVQLEGVPVLFTEMLA